MDWVAELMMGVRPSGVARLETWFSASMAGLRISSSAFLSTENGIPGGKPRASSLRVSIHNCDISRLRPRGVKTSSFIGHSMAFVIERRLFPYPPPRLGCVTVGMDVRPP